MKRELQKGEIISKNEFGTETRCIVNVGRGSYLTKKNLFCLQLKRRRHDLRGKPHRKISLMNLGVVGEQWLPTAWSVLLCDWLWQCQRLQWVPEAIYLDFRLTRFLETDVMYSLCLPNIKHRHTEWLKQLSKMLSYSKLYLCLWSLNRIS